MEDSSAVLASRTTNSRILLFGNVVLGIVGRAFSCWHCHTSRPFTLWGRTYEVCLDCGKELPYSLEHMSRVKEKY